MTPTEVSDFEMHRALRLIDRRVVELRRDGYYVEFIERSGPIAVVRLGNFDADTIELLLDPLGLTRRGVQLSPSIAQ
jgi:hypothetical protein